jgi:hypothetical protein
MTIPALKSILMGVGGSLLLAVFCSSFLAIEKVLFILPLFIGFNGAVTGYRLVEVMKNSISNVSLFSFVLGIGGGALTFVAVNFAVSFIGNWFLLNLYDLVVYMAVSGITSYLGARLAAKYFNL